MSSPSYTAADLQAEIARSPLGAALLSWAAENRIRITVEDNLAAIPGAPGNTFGRYDHAIRHASVAHDLPYAAALHILLHELRHALQNCAHQKHGSIQQMFNIQANPTTAALHNRLIEIDADVFAVYCLYDHAKTTGSAHYDALANLGGVPDYTGRARLYSAFDTALAWYEKPEDIDINAVLLETAMLWSADNRLPLIYDRVSATYWRETMHDVIYSHLTESTWGLHYSPSAKYMNTPRPVHMQALAIYARIYNDQMAEAGFPRFIDREDVYVRRVVAQTPPAREIVEAEVAHESLCQVFRARSEEVARKAEGDEKLRLQRRAKNQAKKARRDARRAGQVTA